MNNVLDGQLLGRQRASHTHYVRILQPTTRQLWDTVVCGSTTSSSKIVLLLDANVPTAWDGLFKGQAKNCLLTSSRLRLPLSVQMLHIFPPVLSHPARIHAETSQDLLGRAAKNIPT